MVPLGRTRFWKILILLSLILFAIIRNYLNLNVNKLDLFKLSTLHLNNFQEQETKNFKNHQNYEIKVNIFFYTLSFQISFFDLNFIQ
uniref:Uncharacterized protein n=1 Tax=Heterorhabditis bacteriophora TaxID=37862 RepID=A0A1I7WSQ8_HETBA